MPLTPTKYDSILVKRNQYRQPVKIKYTEEKEVQLRMYFRCESSHYTKNMKINLWFSKHTKNWRWTLGCDEDPRIQESGSQPDLRDAMNDVATTVEYIINKNTSV